MSRWISRPCYDKPHRCPGWAGPGWHHRKTNFCRNGYIDHSRWVYRLSRWRFGRCRECKVVVLPFVSRRVDPMFWAGEFRHWRVMRELDRPARPIQDEPEWTPDVRSVPNSDGLTGYIQGSRAPRA